MRHRSFFSSLSFPTLLFVLSLAAGCGDVLGCPPGEELVDGFCVDGQVESETETETESESESEAEAESESESESESEAEAEAETETESETEPEAGAEPCDGIDNDDDGEVDEGHPALGTPCGSGVGVCEKGQWVCSPDGKGVVCEGAVTGAESETACDGLDNDCNGEVDENWPELGSPCGSSIGQCRKGTTVCSANGLGVVCEGEIGASEELCDNLDNDCNGTVDDGYVGLGAPCGSSVGACSKGRNVCSANGRAVVCEGSVGPAPKDICDNVDNDCNGIVDDGHNVGAPCGESNLGECQFGVTVCLANGESGCKGEVKRTGELCDNLDNDCDGVVDNGFDLGQSCGDNTGECQRGVWACDGKGDKYCAGQLTPKPEICDGLDNDCDGIDDNGPKEVCDGLDNDCDGLVDEDVLRTKAGPTGIASSTLTTIPDGFVLTQVSGGGLTAKIYDQNGKLDSSAQRSGLYAKRVFSSSGQDSTVYVAFETTKKDKYRLQLLPVETGSGAQPSIGDPVFTHANWDPLVTDGRAHPRIIASANGTQQLLGNGIAPEGGFDFQDVFFYANNLAAAQATPYRLDDYIIGFDIDSDGFVAWHDYAATTFRIGKLSSSRKLPLGAKSRPGTSPSVVGAAPGTYGLVYLDGVDTIRLSEIDEGDDECFDPHGICDLSLGREIDSAVDIGYRDGSWVVATGSKVYVVSYVINSAPVVQELTLPSVSDAKIIDTLTSGDTTAILTQNYKNDYALTFLGCF